MSEIILLIGLCLFFISFILFCVSILCCFNDRWESVISRIGITSAMISIIFILSFIIYKVISNSL